MRKLLALAALLTVSISTQAAKPSFVFIFGDDMGWTGTSVEMIKGNPETKSDSYLTPNIETLAAQGMRFSSAYAPAALCTPSRAAILTGKTPAELHITTPGRGRTQSNHKLASPRQEMELPSDETTIAELLKKEGYATADLGKWHLGKGNPGQHGFDVHGPKHVPVLNSRTARYSGDRITRERDNVALGDGPRRTLMRGFELLALSFRKQQDKGTIRPDVEAEKLIFMLLQVQNGFLGFLRIVHGSG